VYFVTWPGDEVPPHLGVSVMQWLISQVARTLPLVARINNSLRLCIALQKKPRTIGDLCFGCVLAKIPHYGRKDILTWLQERRDFDGFKAPMIQIASGRSPHNALLIYVELISVVACDVNDE